MCRCWPGPTTGSRAPIAASAARPSRAAAAGVAPPGWPVPTTCQVVVAAIRAVTATAPTMSRRRLTGRRSPPSACRGPAGAGAGLAVVVRGSAAGAVRREAKSSSRPAWGTGPVAGSAARSASIVFIGLLLMSRAARGRGRGADRVTACGRARFRRRVRARCNRTRTAAVLQLRTVAISAVVSPSQACMARRSRSSGRRRSSARLTGFPGACITWDVVWSSERSRSVSWERRS